MATIQDVARYAAVSTATVSRVLSQPGLVATATRTRVLQAVERLGYEPNRMARNLRQARASKILLTVPVISNPVFGDMIQGVERVAREAGYAVILGETLQNPGQQDVYSMMLASREVDGIIFTSPIVPPSLAQAIAKQGGRAPIVNAFEHSADFGVSSVHIDDGGAAELAVTHLIELGHRRIGAIPGVMEAMTSRDRLRGVRMAMTRHGLADELRIRHGDFTIESGLVAASALMADGVTGLFCFSDEMAIGALAAVRQAGLGCPSDISVIGFDGIRFGRYCDPPLTTIAQPAEDVGSRAARILLETIAGTQTELLDVILPHELVVRGSTGPAPGR
ncbi:LacI family DNA-binding transcriptional regulator [Sphingomonas sp. MMS24-J13]|uniref:LacI family DNA-binding transcriptional regulator n=1 Tax=Sphingomonas sp. MMS24-J13 TaxID=3238686 RepID=UPI0038514735